MSRLSYLSESLDNPNVTPQDQPIPGETQVQNKAGGFVYAVDKWSSSSASSSWAPRAAPTTPPRRTQTREQSLNLLACIAEDGLRTVRVITEISRTAARRRTTPRSTRSPWRPSRATRPPARPRTTRSRSCAASARTCSSSRSCAISSAAGAVASVAPWATGTRRSEADQLAYQLIKYRQRGGWTHRDLLRLATRRSPDADVNAVLRWSQG
jgi:60 kDa SS-A/Ro ribonucleoprotein